jgi:hypothetical protein
VSNEVAKVEGSKELAELSQQMQEMGMSTGDLLVPRLYLMQNTSEQVGEGKAKLGDILNSQTNEIIGGVDKPAELIPLKLFKSWRVMDMSGKQAEYVREEPWTPENDKRAWEGREDITDKKTKKTKQDVPVRYDLSFNFFALVRSEVQAGEAFPVVIAFRRTSTMAGKALATQMFKRAQLRQAPYSKSVFLRVGKRKQESNTYAVFETQEGAKITDAEMALAQKWYATVDSMRGRVAEEDSSEEVSGGPAPAPTVVGSKDDGAQGPY